MNKNPQSPSKKDIIAFIFSLVKEFKSSLFVLMMVPIVWAVDISFRPYILKLIVNGVASTGNQDTWASIGPLALTYFGMSALMVLHYRFYDYFISIKMAPVLRRKIALKAYSLLVKQNYSYYQNNFAGDLSNKVKDIISGIPDVILMLFDRFISHFLALFIAIFILFLVSPIFAVGITLWSIGIIIYAILVSNKFISLSDKWSEYGSRFTGKLVDSLSNILSVHLFARNQKESDIIDEASNLATIAEQELNWEFFKLWILYGSSFLVVQATNLYFLMKYLDEGLITAGDFVVVLGITTTLADCMWNVAKDFNKFSEIWGKIEQSFRLLTKVPEIQDKEDAGVLEVSKGKIEFRNVRFHYKGAEALFKNKSVTIEPGQKVGLVGYSGGGKSSFVNLILRLFDVSDGAILIDDQDIRSVTQNSLREKIGMIPQEPSLFHRSLMDNIRYGNLESSGEDVIEASKKAHAHEFIANLPLGYDSLVGERGLKLSGGQRQRMAIARAILKNAPILILDEATSQLDSVTEKYIQDSIWELMQGKTSIVIAHRLSTLAKMDRILVFDKGEIIEDGTHASLLAKAGIYKILWDAHKGGFLGDDKENQ